MYRNQLPSEKKGKGEEWPGEWNRGKKRKDREKRREEKRREEKKRSRECREKLYIYCEGETNLRLLRFQGPILVAVQSKTQDCGCLILGSRVRIPPNAQMVISCICCVTSGLCDRLITRSEESYQVRLIVCTLETLKNTNRRPRHDFGFSATGKKKFQSRTSSSSW